MIPVEMGKRDDEEEFVVLGARKGTSGTKGEVEKRRRDAKRKEEAQARTKTKLSSSQRRKLKKLAEEEQKRSERARVIAQLEANKANDETLSLMRSTSEMGKKETAKERMRRALKAERAGVELDELADSRLVKRTKHEVEEEYASDESEEEIAEPRFSAATTSARSEEPIDESEDEDAEGDALTAELEEFVDCVRRGRKPTCSGTEALDALKVAEMVLDSVAAHDWGQQSNIATAA